MTADCADDMQAAEDHAGRLAAALEDLVTITRTTAPGQVLTAEPERYAHVRKNANAAIEEWANYCRPTCRWVELAEPEEDRICDESCDCPCGHPGTQEAADPAHSTA